MSGPYRFTKKIIDSVVETERMGNYVLGYFEGKTLIVRYVGRATVGGLCERLKAHIDEGDLYDGFAFSYAKNIKEAFDEECRLFHEFGGLEKLDNLIHPARPKNKNWQCLYCDTFDE